MNLEVFGWITSVLFGSCYVPQIWLTFKSKQVRDVSLAQWIVQLVAYGCGLVYGFYLHRWPLITGYAWGEICTILFLVLYAKYKDN
jgi:MtN3 and saliva related transmembrane protein